MGSSWLLLLALQVPQTQPASSANAERPGFAIGADFGAAVAYVGEGGGPLLGAGIRARVPLGSRHSLNVRVMHAIPYLSGGMYELRWQRKVDWKGPFKPDYAGVGAVGFYWLDTGLYGRVRPSLGGVTYPMMMSLTAGWDRPVATHLRVPTELSLYVHPYGALGASVTTGLTWSSAPRRGH